MSVRRAITSLLAAITVSAMAIGTASADPATVTRTDDTRIDGNPCTGHLVEQTGFMLSVSHDTGPGYISHNVRIAKGVDLVTGDRYIVINRSSEAQQDFPPRYVETETSDLRFIGLGQTPDFQAHFMAHVTLPPAGEPVVDTVTDKVSCPLW